MVLGNDNSEREISRNTRDETQHRVSPRTAVTALITSQSLSLPSPRLSRSQGGDYWQNVIAERSKCAKRLLISWRGPLQSCAEGLSMNPQNDFQGEATTPLKGEHRPSEAITTNTADMHPFSKLYLCGCWRWDWMHPDLCLSTRSFFSPSGQNRYGIICLPGIEVLNN